MQASVFLFRGTLNKSMDKFVLVGGAILILALVVALTQGSPAVSLVSDKDIIGTADAIPFILVFFLGLGAFAFAMGAVLGGRKVPKRH